MSSPLLTRAPLPTKPRTTSPSTGQAQFSSPAGTAAAGADGRDGGLVAGVSDEVPEDALEDAPEGVAADGVEGAEEAVVAADDEVLAAGVDDPVAGDVREPTAAALRAGPAVSSMRSPGRMM